MEPRRHTLLIVDDEADVLDSLRHLFRRRYRVLTAVGGEEALQILAGNEVQILLSDQRMPGMTGDVLLSKARRDHPETIRLLFTGYADIQAVIHAVNEGGIYRYILKPWDSEELEAVVRQAAEQFDLLDERKRLSLEIQAANDRLILANRELGESMALKTAFLEVASHELNTPITIVQGLSDLLLLLKPDRDEREREIVSQLSGSARQLGRLVSTMLKLMRADDFRRPLRASAASLDRIIEAAVDQVRPFVEARRLTLALDLDGGLGEFEVDADKIRDALLNLLTNAIKFTPDGGEISLSGRLSTPDEAEIRVEDRGIGLEPRALGHLFQPFFTEFDPSRHSSGNFEFGKRGMGLGLSLVKKFVELHGGSVSAESELGRGTRVTIRLPRSAGGPAGLEVQSDTAGPAGAIAAPSPTRRQGMAEGPEPPESSEVSRDADRPDR